MAMSRRDFMERAALAGAGVLTAGLVARADAATAPKPKPKPGTGPAGLRIGMCDWSLGKGGLEGIALAKQVGLDGLEASVAFPGPDQHLRDPAVCRQYREEARRKGVALPSLALGILNEVPLASEPKAALWLADSIEAARRVGAGVILVAFFGRGEIKPADAQMMGRLVDLLRELAPRAERAGVTLGLENTLSAADNLALVDKVGSSRVQVYYDPKNSADLGRDPAAEIRALGSHVCQVHLKNGDRLLSEESNVDFPAVAAALREVKYPGWLVLETANPHGVVADTRANIEYVRRVFAM